MNIAGHRVSSGEIESVCISHKDVHEACAISNEDEISGEKIILFLSLKNENENINNEISI